MKVLGERLIDVNIKGGDVCDFESWLLQSQFVGPRLNVDEDKVSVRIRVNFIGDLRFLVDQFDGCVRDSRTASVHNSSVYFAGGRLRARDGRGHEQNNKKN